MVDDFEHGPLLGAKEFPGPRGKHEGVPSGDGQRAHKKVLVGRQVRRELERVRKETWGRYDAVSLRARMWLSGGRTDNVGHGYERKEGGDYSGRGREGLSRWRENWETLVI